MSVGKIVGSNFASEVDFYWVGKEEDLPFSCPNVSLFRLIGGAVGGLKSKRVLEVGFAHGADLMECKRRGADVVGLDLNPNFVETVKANSQCDVRVFRAGTDAIPFDCKFDLIYSRDTIYYLTDDELKQFFGQCADKLEPNGRLIVQFIETDLRLSSSAKKSTRNFDIDFLSHYEPHQIHSDANPIRFLVSDEVIEIAASMNLLLVGSKRMLQSYDLNEEELRVDKYLIFKKV
jgi:hypothetical protein